MNDAFVGILLFLVGLFVPRTLAVMVIIMMLSGSIQPTPPIMGALIFTLGKYELIERFDREEIKDRLARIHEAVDRLDHIVKSIRRLAVIRAVEEETG